ncbi:flagellar hook-basal body complex protein FliE [Edaphobacter modestus]|uniref:Flagellar hook-basal body complex protein FliE n=1 Tax=Edaphobacter modestus TaxID=388466 RepID=A0A4Q7YQ69_9BACT|nr:flagellar hook-basal body complex protein FliE [Edaphobacter modestus]RZU39588.1 flagellar hook-basal body complex protein FliE [Edaphobacter modestus]
MSDVLMGSKISAANGFNSIVSQGSGVAGGVNGKDETGTPFAGLLQSMVQQTSALDDQASTAVSGLLSGQGVDIHQAMIATQKANMAFELALQVRNKAVGAYQQMMGMQF